MMRKVAYVFCRCHNCATNISDISNLPTIMDWSQVHISVNTRNSESCSCLICELNCSKKGRIPKLKRGVRGKNVGKSTTVTVCSKCLSSINHGKNHNCNSTTLGQVWLLELYQISNKWIIYFILQSSVDFNFDFRSNIMNISSTSKLNIHERIASDTIKEIEKSTNNADMFLDRGPKYSYHNWS